MQGKLKLKISELKKARKLAVGGAWRRVWEVHRYSKVRRKRTLSC